MATPTYATVLSQINAFIVANGNNEITAEVLNPILKLILDFANNTIGDLDTLTTSDKTTIVNSINSLKTEFDNLTNSGVQLYTGYNDPNVTPPPVFNYADFYMQLLPDDDSPLTLWQWNGTEWTTGNPTNLVTTDDVQNNSSVPGAHVTEALNNLLSATGLPTQLDFEANGVDNFIDIGTTEIVKSVFYGSVIQLKENWTQTDNIVTFSFIPDAGLGYKNLTFI